MMLKCTLSNTTQEFSSGYLSDTDIDPLVLLNSKTTLKNLDLKKNYKENKRAQARKAGLNTILGCFWFPLAPST